MDLSSRMRAGHTGPLCDVCQPGFFRGPGTQGCLMCSSAARLTNIAVAASVFVALPVLLVLLCAVLDIRRRRKRNSSFTPTRTSGTAASSAPPQHVTHGSRAGRMSAVGLRLGHSAAAAVATLKAPLKKMPAELRARWTVKVRTLLSMVQILALLSPAFSIRWPENYSLALGSVGLIANLNPVGMLGLACDFAHYDWHATLVQTTMLPLALIVLLVAVRRVALRCCARAPTPPRDSTLSPRGSVGVGHARHSQSDSRGRSRRVDEEPVVARYCATGVSTLLLLVYPRTSATIFSAFNCDTFAVGDGAAEARYLHEDLSIDCASTTHLAFRGYASVMIGVFPLGVPALFALLLWRERRPIARLATDVKHQHAVERAAKVAAASAEAAAAAAAAGGTAAGVAAVGRRGSNQTQGSITGDACAAAHAVSEFAAVAGRRESAMAVAAAAGVTGGSQQQPPQPQQQHAPPPPPSQQSRRRRRRQRRRRHRRARRSSSSPTVTRSPRPR